MNPQRKIWLWAGIALLTIVIIGGVAFYFRDAIKSKFAKNSKSLASNFPGKLIGPAKSSRATVLYPEKIIYWTNYYRKQNGLNDLTTNSLLTKAAQEKVNDMFSKQYFEHVSPTGVAPSDLVSSVGYSYKVTGENLALGDFTDEKDLVDSWMNSPGHRANILNKDYTEIGVATGLDKFQDRSSAWLAVQEFGKPLPNCSKPNQDTLNDINSKKSQLDNLNSQITSLSAEASNLSAQGNAKIQQGNDIYAATHDAAQAQPYWDEGKSLQDQAKAKISQAQSLQAQAASLSTEIQKESNQYNGEVNTYNTCIAQ